MSDTNGKYFPLKIEENEKFIDFCFKYIKVPIKKGVNRITIHTDGHGIIMNCEEFKKHS